MDRSNSQRTVAKIGLNWLYRVVEPLAGWHFYQEYDHLNSETFQKFLDVVPIELGDDMALIQMDRASAHQALALCWTENIIPIFQPSHCLLLLLVSVLNRKACYTPHEYTLI